MLVPNTNLWDPLTWLNKQPLFGVDTLKDGGIAIYVGPFGDSDFSVVFYESAFHVISDKYAQLLRVVTNMSDLP